MSETLLTVNDLKVHFPVKKGLFSKTAGYVYAVDGVSLTLEKGETLESWVKVVAERRRWAWPSCTC